MRAYLGNRKTPHPSPLPIWEREQEQTCILTLVKSRNRNQVERARGLREEQSPPEGVLWSMLRNRQIGGFKFRRQMPLGPYVVDFCCPEAKLVIELDSSYHAGMQDQDAKRDQELGNLGYLVLRFTASDLAKNKDGVLSTIHRIAIERVRALE